MTDTNNRNLFSEYRKGGRYHNPNITCIKVTFETRDRLKALGSKGETYNDIINRIIIGPSTVIAHPYKLTNDNKLKLKPPYTSEDM